LAGFFQVLLHWLLQKPCQTPNQKTASKLKPWRSHFAICAIEVKPKIVASRGFFPTCDIEATTTAILPNFTKWLQLHQRSHYFATATAAAVLATAETLPKGPLDSASFEFVAAAGGALHH
jgi:hypothetical protein